MQLQLRETVDQRRHKNSMTMAAALFLLLAGAALLAQYLSLPEFLAGWGTKIAAAVVLVVGAILLGKLGSTA